MKKKLIKPLAGDFWDQEFKKKGLIKYLRIGFENTEIIDVHVRNIVSFSYNPKSKDTLLVISKRLKDKSYICYGTKNKIFKRLTKYSDITSIAYLDMHKIERKTFDVTWAEDCDESNRYQTYRYEKGNLLIMIKKINEEYFDDNFTEEEAKAILKAAKDPGEEITLEDLMKLREK